MINSDQIKDIQARISELYKYLQIKKKKTNSFSSGETIYCKRIFWNINKLKWNKIIKVNPYFPWSLSCFYSSTAPTQAPKISKLGSNSLERVMRKVKTIIAILFFWRQLKKSMPITVIHLKPTKKGSTSSLLTLRKSLSFLNLFLFLWTNMRLHLLLEILCWMLQWWL